ncbi:MAG: crossover junction endodeoxyribonuclease RuvC [Candidatus Levybacteria bacterium RIFCSPLOWO2_01_FULL_38_13]|nr:MAG: crossover junction endodeoxyribonuclease RuvC [Candidatus Levybacteria bacterium RIFCSPHIGHO2_01_FULL_41_15]OGH35769.1 MAG: crossover junction endodeoxyribonuclease RuvC [Candidatus Levybacteria bacterium RIFCSPLOWO2_01_FULL_38_13]
MRVLGIDPGIARTGWGVIESQKSKVKSQNFGCIETSSKDDVEYRLKKIYSEILKLIEKYSPDSMAIEELFFNTNAKTAFIVGQARGVILLAGAEKNIPLAIYTPLQVKIAVTGYGRAEKAQMGKMVKTILNLNSVPKPDDTADALAVGLTYLFSNKRLSL